MPIWPPIIANTGSDVFAPPPLNPAEHGKRALLPLALMTLCVLTIGLCSSQPLAAPGSASGFKADVIQEMRLAAANSARATPSLPVNAANGTSAIDIAALAPARPLRFRGSAVDRDRAIECLALAAWYEAGDDPLGQRSVIQVVLNRMNHPSFPKSVCGVIFQGSHLSTGCQFTFTCDGSLDRRHPSTRAVSRARALARSALDGEVFPDVMQATHYHADYVDPWWSGKLQRLAVVRRHIFYRWPGGRGSLLASAGYAGEQDLAELRSSGTLIEETDPGASSENLQYLSAKLSPSKLSGAAARLPAHGSAKLVAVDQSQPSGRWAVNALGQCKGKAGCQIVGYDTEAKADQNRSRPGASRERPLFLFVRDAVSGMDIALWDCAKIDRPNASQCLPEDGAALRQLMRERGG